MKRFLLLMVFLSTTLFAFENITTANFDEKVKGKKVILDFYATWCPPCKIISKNLKEYEKTKTDDVVVYKINIDEQRDLLGRFDVRSIPTLVYLDNGEPVYKEVGVSNAKEISANVKSYLH